MPRPTLSCDTNILIDVEVGGLLARLFHVAYRIAVPDVLFAEELAVRHADLPALGLTVLRIEADGIRYAEELAERYSRVAVARNDLLVLALARQEGCPVLTGDRQLRMICDQEGHEVHGTLWLMDRLFDAGLVSVSEADSAYARMREGGRRLPWSLVRKQIMRFRTFHTPGE